MRKYINSANVPLSVALYLATDHYDHDSETISATALLKPTRQLILARRVPEDLSLVDVMGLVKSRIGTSVHDGIERAWTGNVKQGLLDLGYPERVADRVVVNPDPDNVPEGAIPVYMEIRSERMVEGVRVSGKFDFVAEGRLEDFKNTGTFTWVNNTKDEDYRLQGSIYRWLNPQIITADEIQINFIFSDWQAMRAKTDDNYPNHPVMTKRYSLLSEQETENFIKRKLREVDHYKDAPEPDLPLCSDKDLWRRDPQFKYYKNPDKMTRSTKNFEHKQDAYNRLATDGGKGIVVEVPGEVVACKYCAAFPICSQKDELIANGSLKL